uniref:Ulp1 protease family protein n=1 Tax=Brassica oleracea TaxID=3712 RepID=Q2A9J1_BRAOL|nr:Ulp1 protease family protein [Brassica oleracea]
MEMPELPSLHDDKYEELKESKLGVFIKFQELGFDWPSRLVHYMLGFQLDIKKKYELWSLVGPQPVRFSPLEFENLTGLNCEYIEDLERPHCVVTKELTSFWEMLGVHVEAGPSTQEIIAALERCKGWFRDDRKRLAYLAIFIGYIEGRKYSTPTRVSLEMLVMELERFENYPWGRVAFKVLMDSVKGREISGCYTINGFAQALQVWVYTALPELGDTYGNPLPNNPSPPILAYKGRKGRKQFKEAILSQTRVINFVQKDIGQIFPKWEFDVEDTPAEKIIKLMFVKKPWKWTMDCWKVTGTWVNTKSAVVSPAKKKVVMEDSPRPRKKAREEAPAEASEEAAAEASEEGGSCGVEGGITTKRKGTSSQNTTSPPKPTLEPGSESVNGTNAGRTSLAEDKSPDVSAAVPTDASSSKDKAPEPSLVLLDKNQPTVSDLQKEDARYQEKRDAALALCRANTARVIIPNKKLYPGYNPFAPIDKKKLKDLADWLKTCLTPLDKKPLKNRTWWYQILRTSLEWLEDCMTWIAMWISIPKRHIVVFDSNCSSISPKELDVVMEPFLYMVPYLLVECASSDEQRAQYSLEPFTYDRPTNIPPARAGDYGVYTLKYIECHALGIEFSKKDFAKANGKTMRDKMAMDIL